MWALLLVFLSVVSLPINQPVKAAGSQLAAATDSHVSGMTVETILAKLLERNRLRESRLQQLSYSVPRTYRVRDDKGKVRAEAYVWSQYRAPSVKEFKILSQKGSGMIFERVFKPLMESEIEAAARGSRQDSAISPDNYTFNLLGEEDVDGHRCFLMQANPKRSEKYLFKGKIWIHASEFAIVKIAGQPAKNLSFWIKRVDFVRRFQKVGEFWLPLKDESTTQVRIAGTNFLTVDYDHYEIAQSAIASKK